MKREIARGVTGKFAAAYLLLFFLLWTVALPGAACAEWHSLGQGVDGAVYALAFDDAGKVVYAGGDFGLAGGQAAENIAAWLVEMPGWEPLGGGLDGPVRALAWDGERYLYAAGTFARAFQPGGEELAAANIARWDSVGLSWQALGDGLDGEVRALAWDPVAERLYAGGNFGFSGLQALSRIASWDPGAGWEPLGAGVPGTVRALAAAGGRVYVGGDFDGAGGEPGTRNIACWDRLAGTWSGLSGGLNGPVFSIALAGQGTIVYAGGAFSGPDGGGADLLNIARWSANDGWRELGDGFPDPVRALALYLGDLPPWLFFFAGGDFLSGGPENLRRVASWDGNEQAWLRMGDGVNGRVRALAFDPVGMRLYVGGDFSVAGNINALGIAFDDLEAYFIPFEPGNCFLATAAFGSADDGPVRALRAFRDRRLLAGQPGRRLVGIYYRHSPPMAAWLKARPGAAALARTVLRAVAGAAGLAAR